MKKITIIVSIFLMLILSSCGSEEQKETNLKTQDIKANTVNNTNNNLNLNTTNMQKKQGPVKNGDIIEVHYKGTLEDGTVFDSSYDRNELLSFTVGSGQMIPGFDKGVLGLMLGEKKILKLEPIDAYGEYDKEKKDTIKKTDLVSFTNAGYELKVGEKLPTQMGPLEIVEVTGDNVTLDINHPLAGKKLTFEVELVSIK